MPRTCTVCSSPDRSAIDDALVAGRSQSDIASEFKVGEAAIQRHRKAHLSPALMAAHQRREERQSVKQVDRLDRLMGKVEALVDKAEEEGNTAQFLTAARELRQSIELMSRLTGELDERPQVQILNVLASAEVAALLQSLMTALEPFPEARIAAADVLDVEEISA